MLRRLAPVILLAATSTAASAGTYLGLGIGSDAKVSDSMTNFSSDGRSVRFVVGQRWGRLAVEGAGNRFGMVNQGRGYDSTSIAVAGKYNLPLGDHFEAFGRFGLQRTWLSTDSNYPDWSGNGYLFGAGFEYRLTVPPVAGASIFVDYEHDSTGLETDSRVASMRKLDGSVGLWTIGLTVSL